MSFIISTINQKNIEENVFEVESKKDVMNTIKQILKDLPPGWIIEIENDECSSESHDEPPGWLR